jgi:hypothetical protein
MAIERIMRTIKGEGFEKLHDYLKEEDFSSKKTYRFGLPEVPTCVAHHSVQSLLAIGNYKGMVKILGKPGIETTFWHPEEVVVKQLAFIPDKSHLLSLCDNGAIYLWSFEEKIPEIVHKLTFQQKQYNRPTCLHLSSDSQWAFIGSDGGDVYILDVNSMHLCGYVIYWNKCCGSSRCGRIVDVLENPWDPDKLLIGFAGGLAVVWSLQKSECQRYKLEMALTAVCWGDNGKTFHAAYEGGLLATWNLKTTSKPDYLGKPTIDGLKQPKHPSNAPCKDIKRIYLVKRKDGDPLTVIAGGEADSAAQGFMSTISVYVGRSTARLIPLDMALVDLLIMKNSSPEDDSVVVLCDKGLKAYSLSSKQNTPLSIPYPLDLHTSPVTCLSIVSNVSDEITSTLMSMRSKCEVEERGSLKPLMLSGGKWGKQSSQRYSADIILTGHADGSIRLWNLVGALFQEFAVVETSHYLKKNVVKFPQKNDVDGAIGEGGSGKVDTEQNNSPESRKDSHTSGGSPSALDKKQSQSSLSPTDNTKAPRPSVEKSQSRNSLSPSQQDSATTPTRLSPRVTSPKSPPIFGFSPPMSPQQGGADSLGIAHIWFGFEDAYLAASNLSLGVMLFALDSKPKTEDVKVVDISLNQEADDSPHTSPPDSRADSPAGFPPPPYAVVKNGRQLPPGFHMQLYCNTYIDNQVDINSLAINCVVYSSKLKVLVYGTNRGLAVVDSLKGIVLSTITSNEVLQLSADPRRRRESVPAVFTRKWQTVRHKDNSREEPRSPKGYASPNTISRRRTTPDIGISIKPFSSTTSLPEPPTDVCCITALKMAEMAVDKHVHLLNPVLWVATSQGLVAGLQLMETCIREKAYPPAVRQVDIVPSGLAYELKSNVLNMFTISDSGHHLPTPCARWIHSERTAAVSPVRGGIITRIDSKSDWRPVSYIVCVSETRLKAYEILKSRSIAKTQLVDGMDDFLRSADFCWIKETPCLMCSSINGRVFVVAIKGLHTVTEMTVKGTFEFCPLSSMCVSELGRIFFMANDQELQLVSLYKADIERSSKALPDMYIDDVKSPPTEEQQSSGLFSSLFGQKTSPADRKQLFGGSGRPPPVAKSEAGLRSAKMKKSDETDGMKGKLQKLAEGIDERGQRLTEMEEKTEQVRVHASDFEDLAARLARKYQ